MSSNWNVPLVGLNEQGGEVTATSTATVLASSYTQLIAATNYEWCGFLLDLFDPTANGGQISIGIGAAAAEFPIIDRLLNSPLCSSTYASARSLYFPLRVPAGSRISGKDSAGTTKAIIRGMAAGMPGVVPAGAFLELAGSAGGTTVDPGGTANTKGSWTQLTASTGYDWKGIYVEISAAGGSSSEQLVDIAIGGAGSEQIIAANLLCHKGSSNVIGPGVFGPIFTPFIQAGTRIAARAQNSSTTTTSRNLLVNVHGIV